MSSISFQFESFHNYVADEAANDPNRSLWTAVVYQAIKDVEDQLIISHREIKRFGIANVKRKFEIERALSEVNNDWFEHVCLEADVDPDRIRKVIKNLFNAYDLSHIPFGIVPSKVQR